MEIVHTREQLSFSMNTSSKQKLISVFGNSFNEDDVKEVKKVLQSHLVGIGEVTGNFEHEFKNRIGFKYASAVSSCTNGFWLLMRALNVKPQDEVIIPNIHFYGIKNVMSLLNINYKIADVGKPLPNITLKDIKNGLTENTKAIIFLEYGGYPVLEIDIIRCYLKSIGRNDVLLILDAANSPFTKYKGIFSALNYDFAVYSFDMNKILVTGNGGMVLSDNKRIIEKVKSLANFGIVDPIKSAFLKSQAGDRWWEINSILPSLNLVMNNIAASLGLTQLTKIEKNLTKRNQLVENYHKTLKPLETKGLIELPQESEYVENNVYFFWLILNNETARNNLAKYLLQNNIYTTVKYQPLDTKAVTPNAYNFYNRSLILPLNQNLTHTEQKYIVKNIYGFFNHAN